MCVGRDSSGTDRSRGLSAAIRRAITESCVALSGRPPLIQLLRARVLAALDSPAAAAWHGMKVWTRLGSHSLASEETFWL